jgi:hypothetical protein
MVVGFAIGYLLRRGGSHGPLPREIRHETCLLKRHAVLSTGISLLPAKAPQFCDRRVGIL